MNQVDFTSLSEAAGTLLVDFHRINHEGDSLFPWKGIVYLPKKSKKTEIIGIVVLDDNTVSSLND